MKYEKRGLTESTDADRRHFVARCMSLFGAVGHRTCLAGLASVEQPMHCQLHHLLSSLLLDLFHRWKGSRGSPCPLRLTFLLAAFPFASHLPRIAHPSYSNISQSSLEFLHRLHLCGCPCVKGSARLPVQDATRLVYLHNYRLETIPRITRNMKL